MKHIGYFVSINKDSNKVIGHSDADFSVVRPGSFIRFGNDDVFYTVIKPESLHFIKDFEVISNNQIKINGNIDNILLEGDTLYLTYKEYELNTLLRVVNGGSGYKTGDFVYVDGGILSINLEDNQKNPITFKIDAVDGTGAISSLSIHNNGKYIICPNNIVSVSGGFGSGARLELVYKILDLRANLDRSITKIDNRNSETIIDLNYYLPDGLKEGKISCEKYTLILKENYKGENKINVEYSILRDVTPYFGIPLAPKNTKTLDLIFNEAILKIDQELKKLKDLSSS